MKGPANLAATVLARRHYRAYLRSRELVQAPFELHFGPVPGGWIVKACWGDLTELWRAHGVPAVGYAGFFCGGPDEEGRSTLWCPESPAYLAWCGAYVFRPQRFDDFLEPEAGASRLARKLGYEDDMSWSRIYGDRRPHYEEIKVERLEEPLAELPYSTESYYSVVRCHSYLGPRSYGLKQRFASMVMARVYQMSSGIRLPDQFFCPTRRLAAGHDYEDVQRHVLVLRLLFPEQGVIYAAYATAVAAIDGKWNYWKILEEQFRGFFKGLRLESS